MKEIVSDVGCVKVLFDTECPNCGEYLNDSKEMWLHIRLADLLDSGIPVCSCGTDFEWTGDVKVIV